ncbi:hypothetical protein DL96DRAFT_1553458 [Flagelloscypha sp. PMI_526]|nr:hypothetical protein DL96DRAFT_1553458 [Flagelloscypha sp. PMI_526]
MDTLPPSYDASLSAGPSSLPALQNFACITLNMGDRLRMIKFPQEDIDAVRPGKLIQSEQYVDSSLITQTVIQASWRSRDGEKIGIQSEKEYYGSHEFKLMGYPFFGIALKVGVSFQVSDIIRISNLPKDALEAFIYLIAVEANVIAGHFKIKEQRNLPFIRSISIIVDAFRLLDWKTRSLIPTYQYTCHGGPLRAHRVEDLVKLPFFFLSLFEVLESLGYTVESKVGQDPGTETFRIDTIFLKRPLDDAPTRDIIFEGLVRTTTTPPTSPAMDDSSTSMAAAALILALMSLPPSPLPLPTVSLAAPCLDADLLAIHRATSVDEDTTRILRAFAIQNIPTHRPRPEIGGTCISKGWLFGLTD